MRHAFWQKLRWGLALGTVVLLSPSAESAEKLNVVATLSTFADLAQTIGGEEVKVMTIASPKFNPHFIEPKPSDVVKVKRADLLVHAGLDLELWRGPLLDAAGNRAVMPGGERELDLSRGIALLEVPDRPLSRAEGDIHLYGNPHYWLDPENAQIMAQAICEKLCALDPAHEQTFHHNLRDFLARLEAKIPEWQAKLVPYRGRELIGYHNEWPYLMRFAGLTMRHFLEPKPGIPPTPKQLAFLEGYMRERGVRVIAQPTFAPAEASRSLAARTGAAVVTLCQSVREQPACGDYVGMVDYNVSQLVTALSR